MTGEPNEVHAIHAKRSVGGADEAIAEIADRQHGVVTRRQLVELGLGRGAVTDRLRKKRLHPVHRGVYAVGYRRISRLGRWMAAVLACGPGAVLSHRCAGALSGILEGWPATVDITVPCRRRRRDGIRVHEADIAEDERTVQAGIPVTTVARTLLDLAADLDHHQLNRALERAEALRLSDQTPLIALMERHDRRPGTARLAAILERGLRPQITRSELERRFLSFLERTGLPRPRTNVWLQVGGDWIEVDCVWSERRVVVELDGRAYHQTDAAFERDRRRDRRLLAAGWRVARVTARALGEEGLREELEALLSAAAPARSA